MNRHKRVGALCAAIGLICTLNIQSAVADGNLQNVQHIIVVMQENHSFDNYFGALGYVPGGPYHTPRQFDSDGGHDRDHATGCLPDDQHCTA